MDKARHHYGEELSHLQNQVRKLARLVVVAVQEAVRALAEHDEAIAERVITGDDTIDALRIDIEDEATRIMATEQPVATDLRELLASIKIAGDLERIGDHARHLARGVAKLDQDLLSEALPSVREMAEVGVGMVNDTIAAFADQDAEAARRVAERDDRIDSAHRALYARLIELMTERPEWIESSVDLMFLSRFLERLGDHVTNMCEWVVFATTGEHTELNP
jgi:phosphate transport system protein